jgi:hypothetical protein
LAFVEDAFDGASYRGGFFEGDHMAGPGDEN